MGMTIDEALEYLTDFSIYSPYQEVIDKVSAYIEQMQSDYENRLKADMVAMLTEIQLEVHELWDNDPSYIEGVHDSEMVIQQKINSLKENKNESY